MCKNKIVIIVMVVMIAIIGCSNQSGNISDTNKLKENISGNSEVISMRLTSTAFENNGLIPSEFTCDGDDLSVPLSIRAVPANAKSLALIMDDPDAPVGTFVHWVIWNLPPETKDIMKGNAPSGLQGRTDFGKTGYGGPCPPSGTHRYFFKLYALDTILNLKDGSSKKEIEMAMEGHIIERAELVGKYKRG